MQINKSISMAKQPRKIEIQFKDLQDPQVQKAILAALRRYYGRAGK